MPTCWLRKRISRWALGLLLVGAAWLGAPATRSFAQPALLDPNNSAELIPPAIELPAPSDTRSYPPRPIPPRPAPEWIPTPPTPHPPSSLGGTTAPADRGARPLASAPVDSGSGGIDPPIYLGPAPPSRLELPPDIPPNAERWRYMSRDGQYWYYQPSGRWSYWSAGRWVEYSVSKYANQPPGLTPPVPQRRFAVGRRLLPPPAYTPGNVPPGYAPPAYATPPYATPSYAAPGAYGSAGYPQY